MTTKQDLHHLVDRLPDSVLDGAAQKLSDLQDAWGVLPLALRDAPEDDEPETAEEHEAVRRAWEDIRAGRLVSHEEARICSN